MSVLNSGTRQPRWRELCEQALFEADEDRIMQRVLEAQKAITAARQEISNNGAIPPKEELSLRNAENALNCLRSIYERRARERPSAGMPPNRAA